MQRRHLLALLPAAALASKTSPAGAQTGPQPKLPMEKLTIVTRDGTRHELNVEMALSGQQQMTGLMFRPSVPPNEGMLFDWGAPRESAMWMSNTITSLDMLFINQDGTIRRIAERTVPQSLATISSNGPVRATLELAAGTAARLGLRVGDRVEQRIFSTAR